MAGPPSATRTPRADRACAKPTHVQQQSNVRFQESTMLENLTQRLSRVAKSLRGEARLTDANIQDALREVRLALLDADVALPVVRDFIARVREKAVGEDVVGSLTPGQALVGVVHRELTAMIGGDTAPLDFSTRPHRRCSCWPACRVPARPPLPPSLRACCAPT